MSIKTYSQPSMAEHQIRTAQMLMTSGYQVFAEEYDDSEMTALARENDFDFSDDESFVFEEESFE